MEREKRWNGSQGCTLEDHLASVNQKPLITPFSNISAQLIASLLRVKVPRFKKRRSSPSIQRIHRVTGMIEITASESRRKFQLSYRSKKNTQRLTRWSTCSKRVLVTGRGERALTDPRVYPAELFVRRSPSFDNKRTLQWLTQCLAQDFPFRF